MDVGGSNADAHLRGIKLSLVQGLFREGVNKGFITIGFPVATNDVLSLDITPGSFSGIRHSAHGNGGSSIPVSSVDNAESSSGSGDDSLGGTDSLEVVVLDGA